MPVPTFVPPITPSPGLTNKPEVKVLRADFGDSYCQATPDGLNNVRKVYDLSWDVLLPNEADAIVGFFEARLGCEPFLYTIPGTGKAVQFTCEAWSDKTASAGYRAVTATFRQSFNAVP